jgi:hypothetical protein
MLAANAPWWAGEWGNLPHADGDNRPAYDPNKQPTGANATNQRNPSQFPAQQSGQPQASPYKAPDMSAYSQPGGQSGGAYSAYSQQPQYNASNVPRTPPKGARQNDLSGNVPSNQVWGQAYNQVAQQYGMPGATSYTMPGSYSSQSYSPTTGQYGPMSGGQSFDGNMAYNAVNNRPPPVSASAAGLGGNQMPWQDAMSQREAFVGNLSQRLGQYSGGQLTGPVTFDPRQLMQQANDQLANGTFYNPFSQQNAMQNPDVQRAMGNSVQYMQGDFQNPFGSQANIQVPSWSQQSYSPDGSPGFGNDVVNVPQRPDYNAPPVTGAPVTLAPVLIPPRRQPVDDSGFVRQQPVDDSGFLRGPQPVDDSGFVRPQPSDRVDFSKKPGSATPITPPEPGTSYDPQAKTQSLPPVPAAPAPPSYGEDPIAARKKAAKQKEQDAAGLQDLRSRWLSGAATGRSYKEHLGGKNFKDHTPDQMADEYTGELWKRLNDGRLSQTDYDKAVSAMDTDLNQSKAGQAKLKQIGDELSNWRAATYGTWQGSGPPASNFQRIRELERLQERALAGDPAALAWNPKGKAPPPHSSPGVPLNRRGSAARFGGLRQNGDNRR